MATIIITYKGSSMDREMPENIFVPFYMKKRDGKGSVRHTDFVCEVNYRIIPSFASKALQPRLGLGAIQ